MKGCEYIHTTRTPPSSIRRRCRRNGPRRVRVRLRERARDRRRSMRRGGRSGRGRRGVLFVLCVVVLACVGYSGALDALVNVLDDAMAHGHQPRAMTVTMAVVLTSPWVKERVVNAKKICGLVSSFARDGCALAMSSVVDEDAARAIEASGYIARFRRDDAAFGFWSAVRAVTRPREYYARTVSEKKKTRLYEEGDARSRRPGSVGNLGALGVVARFASAETIPAAANATEDGIRTLAGSIWPNVTDAIARAKAFNRAHPERMGDSIAVFEDDANVVVGSAEAYAEKVSSVMRRLPRRWDILTFDTNPRFCRESFFKHPSRAVSRRHGLFQTYTTFSRTTHLFVSRRGALRILEQLPTDIVIDMFLARALRLGKLKIYVACDSGIVDQGASEFQSLGG